MNRRKKIKQLLQAHAKKASAKLAPRKPKYICKADRLKMEAEAAADTPALRGADACHVPLWERPYTRPLPHRARQLRINDQRR